MIRTFRPNIVINGWGGVHGGHGHHQTSGLWTPKAVQMAADPKAFPEQMAKDGLAVWGKPAHPVQILDTERGGATSASSNGYTLPVDDISPLWGKPWREIASGRIFQSPFAGHHWFCELTFSTPAAGAGARRRKQARPGELADRFTTLAASPCPETSFRHAMTETESAIEKARIQALALNWARGGSPLGHRREANRLHLSAKMGMRRLRHSPSSLQVRAANRKRVKTGGSRRGPGGCRPRHSRRRRIVRRVGPGHLPQRSRLRARRAEFESSSIFQRNKTRGRWREGLLSSRSMLPKLLLKLTAWEKLQPEPPPLLTRAAGSGHRWI